MNVTAMDNDTVRFWELPKGQRPVSDWLALARFFAKGRGEQEAMGSAAAPAARVGALADPPSASPSSSASELAARSGVSGEGAGHDTRGRVRSPFHAQWLALRAKHPEVFTISADEIDAWHRHEAWRCESRQDWSNAVAHLSALLETHPDSGDFLPRRAAAHVAWAAELVAAEVTRLTHSAASTPTVRPVNEKDQSLLTLAATNHWELAERDYTRTLAWVDRFPAIAKESRKPFVEKRREVYLKLGRKTEADADEQELKASVQK